ncbi:MAG TPA: carboxypeptidase-like regulatory domain-containing protein [Tepidisphaeraceae bacterium]|jgi:protocatechuate 3,4-dioxygenase beta subunit
MIGFLAVGVRRGGWIPAMVMLVLGATVLPAEGAKSGHVLDSDGKPVSGADVYLIRNRGFEPKVIETTQSGSDGSFELHLSAPTTGITNPLEVQAFQMGKGVGAERYESSKECEIKLKTSTRITLTMLDTEGKPVAGMKVFPLAFVSGSIRIAAGQTPGRMFFMRMPGVLSQRLAGTTDVKGEVTLGELPQGARFEVGIDDERFAYPGAMKGVELSRTETLSPPVKIQLEKGTTISGVVRYGPSGKVAAGIDVAVQPTSRAMDRAGGGGGLTDVNGAYRIAHLGAGEYNVMLNLDAEVQKDWAAAGHEWVKVAGGDTLKDLDFSLVKGGVITGTVITADTAELIANTSIGVHGPAHPQSSASIQYTETGPDGTYSIRVPPGLQHVYISGLIPEAYRQPRQDIRDVKVEDGETVRMNFRLQRRDGEDVKGIVIGLDGKPAADVVVQAQMGSGPFGGSSTKSDVQGRFHFDAIPVATAIEVKSAEVCTAEPAHVQRGQGEIRLQLVRRVKLTLKGLITDENDKPLAKARVRLSQWFGNSGLGEGEPLITGADGRYELKDLYADAQYNIAADAEGFGESQAKLQLDPDAKDLPTLKLPRADATTGGVVVDGEGKPVAGVTVHLNNGMSPKTAVTDAQGRFTFQVVPGKNHLIWVRVKDQRQVGPHANGLGGRNDLKLVLPKEEQ